MSNQEFVLCHAFTTAIGTYCCSIKSIPAAELGSAVIKTTLTRTTFNTMELGSFDRQSTQRLIEIMLEAHDRHKIWLILEKWSSPTWEICR